MNLEDFEIYTQTQSWQVHIFSGYASFKDNWDDDDIALAAFLRAPNYSGRIH
jgi:hypothetical protein